MCGPPGIFQTRPDIEITTRALCAGPSEESSLVLTGSSDLKKHVGHKVTLTGSVSKGPMDDGMKNEPDMLTVGSLTVVGKSCK
jgi:hypothetical protein